MYLHQFQRKKYFLIYLKKNVRQCLNEFGKVGLRRRLKEVLGGLQLGLQRKYMNKKRGPI